MTTAYLDEERAVLGADNPIYTPDDLDRVGDGLRYELLDGRLVERAMGAEAAVVTVALLSLLQQFVSERKLGWVLSPECGYQIFGESRKRVRFPDGSFVAQARFADGKLPRGHLKLPPDLALEVISPSNSADEIEEKRVEFLTAGTPLIWIVYPITQTVHVHRPDGRCTVLTATDELTGDDVLPGFRCRVADLFLNT